MVSGSSLTPCSSHKHTPTSTKDYESHPVFHKALKPKVGNPAPGDWFPTQGMVFPHEQRLPRCVRERGPVAKAFLMTGVWKSAWKPEQDALFQRNCRSLLQVQRSPLVYTLHSQVTLRFQTVEKGHQFKKMWREGDFEMLAQKQDSKFVVKKKLGENSGSH